MRQEAAELIAAEDYDLEVRDDYSGRGMYGEATSAVVASDPSCMFRALAEIMENGDDEDRAEVAEAIRGLRSDSMGRGVVYY